MNKPVRIQLSRKKGFNLQKVSMELNGLPAVNVARPTIWGNDYRVGIDGSAEQCVKRFREDVLNHIWTFPTVIDIQLKLRGKNLACWCKPSACCHADVLLEIANT